MAKTSGLVVVALVFAGSAFGQDLETGQKIYMRHCATCHGVEAKGNGPMAPVLMLQPTNLTMLAANNGSVFPTARVVKRIDGRDPLVSHGSPMPIYGDFFEGPYTALKAPDGMPIITSQPIVDLIAWLQGLQE